MTDKATFTRATATGDLQSLVTNYNANLDTLEAALDDSLSLSGKLPNSLTADLDANSNRLINLADGVADTDAATVGQVNAAALGGASVAFSSITGKPTTIAGYGITDAYTEAETDALLAAKQATLVSGTSIKTVNGNSLLGSGDVVIGGGGAGTTTNALTMNNGGAGAASGTTFDGSLARTISYNSIGAAPLASPTFTGTPAAPTAAGSTNTTQLATTAFVQQELTSQAVKLTGAQSIAGNKTFSGTTALAAGSTIDSIVVGYRDVPITVTNSAKSFALADAGKGFGKDNGTAYTYTIPANASVAFPIGTVITVFNNNATSNITVAITSDTLRLAGSATVGSRTIAPYALCTLYKVAATEWWASGPGVT